MTSAKLGNATRELRARMHKQAVIAKCGRERWEQYTPREQHCILVRSEGYRPPPLSPDREPQLPLICQECGKEITESVWVNVNDDEEFYHIDCYPVHPYWKVYDVTDR